MKSSACICCGIFLSLVGAAAPVLGHGTHSHEEPGARSAQHIAPASPEQAASEKRKAARERLALAVQLTASGRNDDALNVYKQLAADVPEEGVPALARYLALTDNLNERAFFLEQLKSGDSQVPAPIRARGLYLLGENAKAMEILDSAPEVKNGDEPEAALFLAQMYRQAKMEREREELLWSALMSAKDEVHAALLFDGLFSTAAPHVSDIPTSMILAMDKGMSPRDYISARDFLNRVAIEFQDQPNYFRRRDAVLDEAKNAGAGAALFATRLLIREEDHEAALQYLEPLASKHRQSPLGGLMEQERAELMRQVGRLEDSNRVLRNLAESKNGDAGEVVRLEAALTSIATRDTETAAKLLKSIDAKNLPEERRAQYWAVRLISEAKNGNLDAVLDVYSDATEGVRNDQFEFLNEVIFKVVIDTEQHWKLEEMVRARMESDPSASPRLWRLAAAAAREARKMPNEVEALYQYAKANPDDSEALVALAEVVSPIAAELAEAPPDTPLEAPAGEVERVAELAEKALVELIRRRPYDPAPFAALMQLHKAQGKDASIEPARIGEESTNPRIIGTAAFVLATHEYPERAMALYDRALALDPGDMQIRMNRTACLTRLDRWDEAADFYRGLLVNGHNGRGFHVHELVDRLWHISVEQGQQEQGVEELLAAMKKIKGEWRETALEDAGAMMILNDRLEDADKFFALLLGGSSSPELKGRIAERMAIAYFDKDDKKKAEQIFAEALKGELTEDQKIGYAQSRAEILAGIERRDEAITEYQRVAREFPHDQGALLGFFRAAMLAEEKNDMALAHSLYKSFLDSESLNFAKRREAEEKVKSLNAAVGN